MPALRALLPAMGGARVVDLGCGFGWFSRWADDHGASSVLGVDVSTKMLGRARADTTAPTVEYRCPDLDLLDLDRDSADVVFSSPTLHYVHDLDRLLTTIGDALVPGGSLVVSVEHPVYSAPTMRDFESRDNGDRIRPLDNYLVERERVTNWSVDGVVKEHRTIASHVNRVIDAGLALERVVEWGPAPRRWRPNPRSPTIGIGPGSAPSGNLARRLTRCRLSWGRRQPSTANG